MKEKALKYLSDNGYGKGSNFTTNSVATLMVEFAAQEKKELINLLNNMPANRPLVRQNNKWQIMTEDTKDIYYSQSITESFETFIKRVVKDYNNYIYW